MQLGLIARILGIILMGYAFSMLPPVIVDYIFHETSHHAFIFSFIAIFSLGFFAWAPTRKHKNSLKNREGFLLVALIWILLSGISSLPFIFHPHLNLSITDMLFESTSGLTTTGATILHDIDSLPHALLYYRQQLQFLGGMGIIVLAVAILPMLGIGGMQLYRAEMPGPLKDSKLTPRITETAQSLWYLYVGLTILCLLAYWYAGMGWFDAICQSFATVATGGFSTHSSSFAYYNSPAIEYVCSFFMFLGGVNFALHFMFLRKPSLKPYWSDEEFRTFLLIISIIVAVTSYMLFKYHFYPDTQTTFTKALFQTISVTTTTGFTSADFSAWPTFIPYLLIYGALIGGCAASTSGGLKVIRVLLLYKQGMREIKQLIHPQAIVPVKFSKQPLPDSVVNSMWGYIAVFSVLFIMVLLALLMDGLDMTTAFGAVCSSLSNLGASIGSVAAHYADLSDWNKWILVFAMIAGRLEMFTLLVLLTPAFWRN